MQSMVEKGLRTTAATFHRRQLRCHLPPLGEE